MLASAPMSVHSSDLVKIPCSTKFVHVTHGRDVSPLPNLRVANLLHSGTAEDRSKTGVMKALQQRANTCTCGVSDEDLR